MTDAEAFEPEPPETSDADLRNGIFNLMVTLIKYYQSRGMSLDQSCEMVAQILEEMIDALRNRNERGTS